MKRSFFSTLALAALSLGLFAGSAKAEDMKLITGKSSCATCDGVTMAEHQIMIVTPDGTRYVLVNKDAKGYKAAHDVRKTGKTMTATIAGEAKTLKDENGKEYKEVPVSEVKIG